LAAFGVAATLIMRHVTTAVNSQRQPRRGKRMMVSETAERLAYRPDEAARVLGCSRDTVYKLLASGELKGWKLGAARLINADELRRFVREREEQAAAI
jgi:excisionase family DNA binding protein